MSLKDKLLRLKYYLFGNRKELTLKNFRELSQIDPQRGINLVQDDQKGKVYIMRKLTEYNIEKYQYLKKKPVDNSPKICLIHEEDGQLTLAEEFILGDSLEFLLKKNGLMDTNRVVDIARQLCVILKNFHRCKPAMTGHNLSPANVKLSVNGEVYLLETNIEKYNRKNAKVENLPAAERYKDPVGSGVQADIYALGVLMNVLLSGKHPDEGIAEGELSAIIEKCVSSNVDERYIEPMELCKELRAVKKALPFGNRLTSWKRYLLPGFRGKNAYVWLFAAAAYPMLFYIGLIMKFENATSWSFLSRLLFCIIVLALVFFNGNYLNIQKVLPLVKCRRRFLHRLGMLIVNVILLALLLASLNLFPAIAGIF